jgi:hypothetical protein
MVWEMALQMYSRVGCSSHEDKSKKMKKKKKKKTLPETTLPASLAVDSKYSPTRKSP